MSTEKLCRLCMGRSNLIHSVLEDNLLQKIAICVSIMINPADKVLPLDLCALCALKVKDFFEFRQNCLKVQQLLEQDACSRNAQSVSSQLSEKDAVRENVQSMSQPTAPVATVKQENSSIKSDEHLQITKFEVIIDEDDRLSDVHVPEESVEEPDQIVEQLDDIADEDVLVEELVEQDEVFSETEQTIESEQVPERDIPPEDHDMSFEIQMVELNCDQNPSEVTIEEKEEVEYNDEEPFMEDLEDQIQQDEGLPVQESLPTQSAIIPRIDYRKRSHEPKVERNEKEIYRSLLQQCTTCGKSVERNRMEGHHNRHMDVRPYRCTAANCDLAFHCKISRRLHIRNRHGTDEIHCELCGKVYYSKKALYHHKKESHTEKRFSCEECELVFVSNARLNRHMVTHTDEREFKCPYCPKEFYRSNNLKVHIRSHTKEKPFQCSSCDKAFGYQRLLREHMSRHHNVNSAL